MTDSKVSAFGQVSKRHDDGASNLPVDVPSMRSVSGRGALERTRSATLPGPDSDGLVTSRKTGRPLEVPDYPPSILDVWSPKFPSSDRVPVVAGLFTPLEAWQGTEGPTFRIVVSPGALAVESRDKAKSTRTWERTENARMADNEMITAYIIEHGSQCPDCDSSAIGWDLPNAVCSNCGLVWSLLPNEPTPRSEITEWSRQSRSNMFRAYSELDYAPLLSGDGMPGMVTLTYPGDWLTVAPDGKTAKAHFKAFRKRFERAYGYQLIGLWKLEFQDRGAPHFHLFMMVPTIPSKSGQRFHDWLSQTWASVVKHPDPVQRANHIKAGTGVDFAEGMRANDPRRIAVYFSKHSSYAAKEYQNLVPEPWQAPGKGPGRFWGYWGLERCTASVDVSPKAATLAARTMRRWARSQGTTTITRTSEGHTETRTFVSRAQRVPRSKSGEVNPAFVRRISDDPDIGLSGIQLSEGRVRTRKVRRRVKRMRGTRGWISLNDGPGFATEVARYLDQAIPANMTSFNPYQVYSTTVKQDHRHAGNQVCKCVLGLGL